MSNLKQRATARKLSTFTGKTIIRARKRETWTVISNVAVRDPRMSAEALGVLLHLLSRPDDWRVSPTEIRRRFHLGRDKLYTILNELKDNGYLVKQLLRSSRGQILGHEYLVNEEPENARKTPFPEKPSAGKSGRLLKTEGYERLRGLARKKEGFDDFENVTLNGFDDFESYQRSVGACAGLSLASGQ